MDLDEVGGGCGEPTKLPLPPATNQMSCVINESSFRDVQSLVKFKSRDESSRNLNPKGGKGVIIITGAG